MSGLTQVSGLRFLHQIVVVLVLVVVLEEKPQSELPKPESGIPPSPLPGK